MLVLDLICFLVIVMCVIVLVNDGFVCEFKLLLYICSFGFIMVDFDDVMYIVVDEVIKQVMVEVVYGCFFYVGVVYGLLFIVGEVLIMFGGLNLVEVCVGLDVMMVYIEGGVVFQWVNDV